MAVTPDQAGPYAPATAVMSLIDRHRTRGLPSPINDDVLARAGISTSLLARTLYALKVMDLIDGDGKPTEIFESIRKAPAAEYQQRLTAWLNAAYADALQFIDPATADETQIRDAFRNYTPIGQQSRMVSLFMGLYSAAGVTPDRKRQSGMKPTKTVTKPARPRIQTPVTPHQASVPSVVQSGSLPPALAGLLESLPNAGNGWTQVERDRFVTTFSAVLDFCFPVRWAENEGISEEEGGGDET